MTLEHLAEWRGFTVHRSRTGDRLWLIRDGQLFSPRRGHDEATARDLLTVNLAQRSASAP